MQNKTVMQVFYKGQNGKNPRKREDAKEPAVPWHLL